MKIKVIVVAGARPNFIKVAPLMREFLARRSCFVVKLVHTGQHYDFQMSEIFFRHLGIPQPDIYLEVGSGSHAGQTAKIMTAFEKVVLSEKPHLVMVVGDVNSTLACSLVAAKLNIKVAHVEAGLRSFDREMPEEINRLVTDSIADYLFVSEPSGLVNLRREGVDKKKIFFVGNVMIDSLLANQDKIDKSPVLKQFSLSPQTYAVLTLHRPSNVDSRRSLTQIYGIMAAISQKIKIVYPIHPRTRKTMETQGFLKKFESLNNVILTPPLGYVDFVHLVKNARFVLTDSGGIQEETTVLKVPCLTMRENTERPVTIQQGTNYLVGRDKKKILACVQVAIRKGSKRGRVPRFWDGKTAGRIVNILDHSMMTR